MSIGHAVSGIRYISLFGYSGYAVAARRLLLGLKNHGVPLTWTPMLEGGRQKQLFQPYNGHKVGDLELDPICNREIPYDTVVVHLVPEFMLLWRQLEPEKNIILYTAWETDRIPAHWPFFLELADCVAVPSTWNRKVFERAGLRVPVEVLPHIALEPDPPGGRMVITVDQEDFVFLTIDTWTGRKRLESLVRVYLNTFTADDPVRLIIKTNHRANTRKTLWGTNPTTAAEIRRIRREYSNPAKITLLTKHLAEREIRHLYKRADGYLSLSHAEGWGLGAFDAGSYGKPVIATGYGGSLDFLIPDGSYLVNSRMVPVMFDAGKPSFMPNQQWAEPDPVHAGRLMRQVYNDRSAAEAKGRRLQAFIRKRFHEQVLVRRLMDIIERLPVRSRGGL